MRCPSCNSANDPAASRCARCEAPLGENAGARPRRQGRSGRRRQGQGQGFDREDPLNRFALRGFYGSLLGLVPLAGIVTGPIYFIRGLIICYRCRRAERPLGVKLGVLTLASSLFTGLAAALALFLILRGLGRL